MMSHAAESGVQTTRAATQVELVAAAPEPEPPPPPVVRPSPRKVPVAKTPKVEGVPQPKPKKEEPPAPPNPQPAEAKNETPTTTGEVSSGVPPPAGAMISPVPATGGAGSGTPVTGQGSSGPPRQAEGLASKGNASFTAARPDYLHNPPPDYPEDARINHQEGVVILLVDVGQDGNVLKVTLQRSSGYRRLDEAALRAAKDWKFKPGSAAGQPIRSKVEVPVRFKLQG